MLSLSKSYKFTSKPKDSSLFITVVVQSNLFHQFHHISSAINIKDEFEFDQEGLEEGLEAEDKRVFVVIVFDTPPNNEVDFLVSIISFSSFYYLHSYLCLFMILKTIELNY